MQLGPLGSSQDSFSTFLHRGNNIKAKISAFLTKTQTDAANAVWDVIKDQTYLAAGQQRERQAKKMTA